MPSMPNTMLDRMTGPLRFGEAYDDPTQREVDKYVTRFAGNYGAAAKAAWNERERQRQRINAGGGESLLSAENKSYFGGSDPQLLQVAMKLKNLAASGGKTTGPMAKEPPLTDPRLTTQYRNEMERRSSANPMDALRRRLR